MKVDLNKLEERLDSVFNTESKTSLLKWLNKRRSIRDKNRIPININYICRNYGNFFYNLLTLIGHKEDYQMVIERFEKSVFEFIKMYNDYTDLRITQVLVNTNIVDNYVGDWYYLEDDELLHKTLKI